MRTDSAGSPEHRPAGSGDPAGPLLRLRVRRRTLLGAAACAGLVTLNRLLVAADDGPGGPADAAARRSGGPDGLPTASAGDYRLRPSAGGAGTAGRGPVRAPGSVPRTLPVPGHRIALTFDDGPHPEHTPQVLRVLRRYGAPATFFLIGENAAHHPDLVREIAADGHLIANHSWSHPRLDRLRTARVREELGATSDLLAAVLGEAPRWARAPYGAWHRPSLRICAELGMTPLGWSIDTEDWTRPGTAAIARAVLNGAHPGGIVLSHDGGGDRSQSVAALAHYLPRLLDRGYTLTRPA